jgi:hypothetical protein
VLIGPHRCDKQAKKPKRDETISRGSKRDRKEGKRSQRQQHNQDRVKRTRIDPDEERDEDQMMDTDQVEDISIVGTRKSSQLFCMECWDERLSQTILIRAC